MKFNDKYEQMQKESDARKLMSSFEENINLLLTNTSQSVSYQLAYDNVYKLTKMGRQNDVLTILESKLKEFIVGQLSIKTNSLVAVYELLRWTKEATERMA